MFTWLQLLICNNGENSFDATVKIKKRGSYEKCQHNKYSRRAYKV